MSTSTTSLPLLGSRFPLEYLSDRMPTWKRRAYLVKYVADISQSAAERAAHIELYAEHHGRAETRAALLWGFTQRPDLPRELLSLIRTDPRWS